MHRPDSDQPVSFGDIYESDWFYDAHVRETSTPLTLVDGDPEARELDRRKDWYQPGPRRRNTPADKAFATAIAEDAYSYEPAPPSPQEEADENFALLFGEPRVRSIILTDDCAIRKAAGKKAGRIVMAPLVGLDAADPNSQFVTWGRHRMPPDEAVGFEGGYVELARAIPVYQGALGAARRIYAMSPGEQARLSAQWCAHATRHGPIVSDDGVRKLLEMAQVGADTDRLDDRHSIVLTDDESRAYQAMSALLSGFWVFEGQILDEVSDAHEERRSDGEVARLVLAELERLHDATAEALDAAKRALN